MLRGLEAVRKPNLTWQTIMKPQPGTPSEERHSEPEVIPPGHEQAQPKSSDAYVSFWISWEPDGQPGRRVGPILRSALYGIASATAVVILVALVLMSSPLVG